MNEPTPLNPDTTPTDARLDALLDEALAPGPAPAGLNERIVAATADRLADGGPHAGHPVLGRIGGGFAWRSVAAVLLLGGVVGGLFVVNRGSDPVPSGQAHVNVVDTTQDVYQGLDQLADAALHGEAIDDEIALLSMQVSATDLPGVWAQDALDSLDTAIAFEEFDELHDELELYF